MEAIFQDAQLSLAKHRKCTEKLRALQRKATPSAFAEELFGYVACILPVFKREPAAERAVEFVVKYLTEADEEYAAEQDELIGAMCMALLGLSDAKDKAVRFRVSQLVGRVMNAMPAEAEVSDELFGAVEERMLRRCRDKVPVVRACALRALFRLQDPSQPDDVIMAELVRMIETDSSVEVRMAAMSIIAPCKPAIRALLGRTRDAAEGVRKHALAVIREKVEWRWLTISQRATLLDECLADRAPSVRAAGVELARGWLRQSDKQVLVLLKALDVSTHESPAERVISALLHESEARGLVASAAAEWLSLAPEPMLCLRLQLDHLAAEAKRTGEPKEEEALDAAVPELGAYCEALHRAVGACRMPASKGEDGAAAIAAAFSLVQLLRICPRLDMANEHGRAELELELSGLLKDLSVGDDLLPPLVGALEAVCVGEGERFGRLMHELISEVDDPLEGAEGAGEEDPAGVNAQLEAEQRRMFVEARLLALHAEVKTKVDEEDFEAAAGLKKEAAELQQELQALQPPRGTPEQEAVVRTARCLKLAELLMRAPGIKLAQHEMDMHAQEIFLPALAAPQPKLRALALRCLGLRALGCPVQAAKTWPLFVKALAHDQLPVQLAALGACTDLLIHHQPEAILPSTSPTPSPAAAPLAPMEDGCSAAIFELLLPLLRGSDRLLSAAAALAGCRLLHTGRVISSALTARLLLIYFQSDADASSTAPMCAPPADVLADAGLLDSGRWLVDLLCEPKQILSVFFASCASTAQLGAALLPAVRSVLAAAPGSPESSIPVDSLASFVLTLTRPTEEVSDAATSVHEAAALALSCEALAAPEEAEGNLLPRAFAQLVLPLAAKCKQLGPLSELLSRLEGALSDKTALRSVQKLRERVEVLLHARGDADEPATHAGPCADDIVRAHALIRGGDAELSEAIQRERERSRDEHAALTERRRSLTPVKQRPPPKRRLAKGGKATPGMAERLVTEARENTLVN